MKLTRNNYFFENIPNLLTISRIVLTFFVMYMIFNNSDLFITIVIFGIAALTDWFDGRLARWFRWESEFGRQADMIADRILWLGTGLAFIISFSNKGILSWWHGLQLLFIFSREVITLPFALIAFVSGDALPKARYVAKVTTFIQGFALPALILSAYYFVFEYIALPLSLVCLVTGSISALHYINDIQPKRLKIKKK